MANTTVLIMDDEEMVGEIACQMLKFIGIEAHHVLDGRAAVDEYVRRFHSGIPFGFVIMDLTIPGGIGGREAVTEILAIDPSAKVVVSSGYSTDPIMTNYSEYGFRGVIGKPFDLAALQSIVDQMA